MVANIKSDKVLSMFALRLRKELSPHLREVILFGSRSRGEAQKGADYDCLIGVDHVTREIRNAIDGISGDLLFRFGAVFSAFPISKVEQKKRKYSPLLINVEREGILL